MRYPFVYNPMGFTGELFTEQHQRTQQAYEALMAMPEEERRKNMDTLLAKHWDLRQTRDNGEIDFREMFRNFQTILDVMPGAGLLFGRDDFWAALDVRDAAKSIELALLADFEGCHPLYVASTHNSTGVPSRDLAGLFYPEVQTWKRPIEGTESLLNIEKAQTLLGFEPDYSV